MKRKLLSLFLAAVMMLGTVIMSIPASAESSFNDVEGHWAEKYIDYVVSKGLMNGVGDGSGFAPDMNLTRGMVVTVLYRNNGSPKRGFKQTFLDVAEDQYYTEAAEWAYENDIVKGTGTNDWDEPYFSPDRNITRQELAAMFGRYADFKHVNTTVGNDDLSSFPDKASVADWAINEVKWSVGVGLITGKGGGASPMLAPTANASRAEFATIINRFNEAEFEYNLAYETPVPISTYTEPEYPKVEDADIYVAVDGNDTNPGSKEKPLATFEAAKAMVNDLKDDAKDGITVAFKAGDYGILDNIQFTADDAGSEDCPITYCAYGDGDVYFTNGVYISENDFVPLNEDDKKLFAEANLDKIMKTELADNPNADKITSFSPLSNSGGLCWIARVPNKRNGVDIYFPFTEHVLLPDSPYKNLDELIAAVESGVFSSNDEVSTHIDHYRLQTLHVLSEKLASYDSLEGMQLVGYIGKVWQQDAHNLTSYDKETGIVSFSNPPQNIFYATIQTQQQSYINNAAIELDAEGEYWIDPDSKTLYVYNPEGAYTMATNSTFVTVNPGAEHITFRKLNFRCSSGNGIVANANNFTFDLGSITYVGGSYAFESNRAVNIRFTNSTVAYCAESGVCIEGPNYRDNPDYFENNYKALKNTGCVIRNNLIHDVDLAIVPVESGALRFSWQIGADVSHNEIYNSARYGIDFKYGNIDCIMEYNYIHHCMQNSADGGAIYGGRVAINRGNTVRYNIIADIYALNPIHTGGTFAVYLDDSHENFICYGNVFYNSGDIMNNGGRSHEIYDNVFILRGGIVGREGNFSDIRMYADPKADNYYYNEGWNSLSHIPDENTPSGQLWKEKWPELYDILAIREDPSCYKDTAYYSAPLNFCHNNYTFAGAKHVFQEKWIELSDHENNIDFSIDKNPLFVNPSIGNYSIREDADYFKIPYDKIGRY